MQEHSVEEEDQLVELHHHRLHFQPGDEVDDEDIFVDEADDVKLKSDSGAYEPIQVPQCGEMSNKSWKLEFEILIKHLKYHS